MKLQTTATWCALGLLASSCNPAPPNTDFCKGRKAGDLVISEVMADPDGSDTGAEWLELFNALGTPVDLKGVQVYVSKLDKTGLKSHSIRAGTAPARGYFTLGDVRTGPNPAWLNYSYADGLGALSQTEGIIGLRCGALVLDEMSYASPAKPARSHMLSGSSDPDATANDVEGNWCDTPATTTYSGVNAGTPGARNGECTPEPIAGTCLDNGTVRPVLSPGAGDLVITEVMADPKAVADSAGEWVEVLATKDVDLNGLTLSVGASHSTLSSSACLHLAPNEFGVLAHSADANVNGGLPTPKATFTTSLTNSGLLISLSAGDAGIDTATVPAALGGVAWQLAPASSDAIANDDPANFCRATSRYGAPDAGDFGTPGASNSACPLAPDPNSCLDVGTGQPRPIVRPVVGDLTITEFMANPAQVSDTAGEWFEVRANAKVDLNGLVLGNEGTTSSTVSSQSCLSLDVGGAALFARSADPLVNGGLPDVMATFTFSLANSGTRYLTVKSQGIELDRFSYTAVTSGASTQLDMAFSAPADNDVPANVCATPAATTYGSTTLPDGGVGGGDRGTPGATNVSCP